MGGKSARAELKQRLLGATGVCGHVFLRQVEDKAEKFDLQFLNYGLGKLSPMSEMNLGCFPKRKHTSIKGHYLSGDICGGKKKKDPNLPI